MATIKVITFKTSGKYYSSQVSNLKTEHLGYELMDKIKNNDQTVHSYSPVLGGFSKYFLHSIDVEYGTGEEGFCTFLLLDHVDEQGSEELKIAHNFLRQPKEIQQKQLELDAERSAERRGHAC